MEPYTPLNYKLSHDWRDFYWEHKEEFETMFYSAVEKVSQAALFFIAGAIIVAPFVLI